jgi:phage terminase large subunit GpA-like protein
MRMRPLPAITPFRRADELFASCASLLRPKVPVAVSEWAKANLPGYDPDVLPWHGEVMDACPHGDVDLMGPAQCGKSEIGLAYWGWTIDQRPADFIYCNGDKAMTQDFVIRRMEPMIAKVGVLRLALLDKPGSDNIFLKQFKGMLSSHIWPVAAQFRARPVPFGWLDDFDQIPEDIEGQGDAHGLMAARQTWFEGRSGTYASSSPAAGTGLVKEGGGIEARVRDGTNERLAPACPQCGDRFIIDYEQHLHFNRKGSPEEAAISVTVQPPCGCVLLPADRVKLLASCASLPNRGFLPTNPAGSRRTFAIDGLLNVRTWPTFARKWREAEIAWEERQDESPLRTFHNTWGGRNYRSKLAGEKALEPADLERRIEKDWQLGTIPAGPRVIGLQVDVQSNRFEWQLLGFADGLECWIIDRGDIRVTTNGMEAIDPATCPEHWNELTNLMLRRWPLAGYPDVTVPVLTTAVDTHGEKGATVNAYAWARSVHALGIAKDRLTLLRGGPRTQRVAMAGSWVDQKKDGTGANRRTGLRLWNVNTAMLKNMLSHRLRRQVPGPGYIHLPAGFEWRWLEELTAEVFDKGAWRQIRKRNETWDLLVYGFASLMRPPFAQTRSDMGWVPLEFRVPDLSPAAAPVSAGAAPLADPMQLAAPPHRPKRASPTRRTGGFFGRRR